MTLQSEARFSDFVKRQQERRADTRPIDWQKEKDEWLEHLNDLYVDVRSYLSEYLDNGSVRIDTSEDSLHEENIGTYTAFRMMLIIGDQTVVLKPIGTLLIGSKGRVDVEGMAGTSRLVLVDEDMRHLGQLVRVETRVFAPGQEIDPKPEPKAKAKAKAKAPKQITRVWKIASRPPNADLVDLNKETFFQMILEVTNG